MALDDILEGGRSYGSPAEFLEKEEDHLPDDQNYGVENSTGERRTVESLEELRAYLENKEEEWRNLREFVPVDVDSRLVTHETSENAEYFGIEFPYTVMETDYNTASAGQIGTIRLGYLSEEESEKPAEAPVPEMADD
jgi:hypothetical protein